MIKAAIFDMDGLLIDSEPYWQEAKRKALKTVGLEISEERMLQDVGRPVNENIERYYHEHPWEGASQKDIEAMIVDAVIDKIKQEGELRAGVANTIDICLQAGLPLAIASSSANEIIDATVDTLKIRDFFDYIYSAEHEPLGKPHPGVFITAASLLGFPAHQILVFEDAPAGVLAAKAADMRCIAVPNPKVKNHPFILTADVVLNSLEEFNKELLDSL